MRLRCSSGSDCASTSPRSARTASAPWWNASARMRIPRWLRPLSLLAPFALLAQPHLLGELRAGGGVVGRHHRVIERKPPLLAILLRRHLVLGAQMALERL